jgi:hypothetical protein
MGMINVNFRGVGLFKGASVFGLFGFVLGFITGIFFFIFVDAAIESWGIGDIPRGGLFFISFLVVPIVSSFIFTLGGFLFLILLNLFLRWLRGVNFSFNEEEVAKKEIPQGFKEEPYSLQGPQQPN